MLVRKAAYLHACTLIIPSANVHIHGSQPRCSTESDRGVLRTPTAWVSTPETVIQWIGGETQLLLLEKSTPGNSKGSQSSEPPFQIRGVLRIIEKTVQTLISGSHPRDSDSGGLGYSLRVFMSNNFPK